MDYSLYINGVFEDVLEEIRKAQATQPGLVCYLQPYASDKIVKLAEAPPTMSSPLTLYLSLTSSLPQVSYRATIVGWENKNEINEGRLAQLNAHIAKNQPGENEIYKEGGNGRPSVNLLSVVNMVRLEPPIPVSSFTKTSNNLPLKPRSTSGGWSYVVPLPAWVGTLPATAINEDLNQILAAAVSASLNDNQATREQRLAKASKYPEPIQVISKGFKRNPDVVADVLQRADGFCENCGNEAPFKRVKDGTPYLEVHHKVILSDGGEDTTANAVAVCPNCHRKFHFGV
jgi:predicted HNH restriction endonuclease